MSASDIRYNNTLFKNLIPIYDSIAFFLLPVRHEILKSLKLAEHPTILDVACGTGTQAILFSKHGYQVTGVDLSSHMLERAKHKVKEKFAIRFLQADATKLPFKKGAFDATTISFGLHDMPENIRTQVLREMKRVTKKGGRLIVADYATPSDGMLAKMERPISNLFESKYFDSFMKKGLNYYLHKAKLVPNHRVVTLVGIAQLVTWINH